MDIDTIIFIVVLVGIFLSILAVVAGFVFIQVKSSLFWRLSTLVTVIVLCSWSFYHLAKLNAYDNVNEEYARGLHLYIANLDELVVAGRTNDVHKSMDEFQRVFAISDNASELTNFWNLVDNSFEMEGTLSSNRSQ